MLGKKVALTTLGCKVNQYESDAIEELFRQRGYEIVDFNSPSDVYIINTCTVTHLGDRKSRQFIRRAKRTNPEAVVVVTGCYAQTAPDEVLEVEGVDLVVGSGNRAKIVELVEKFEKGQKKKLVGDIFKSREFEELPGEVHQGRVRAYLKIQEGCQNFCSYCIIPYARGPLRSRSPESVLAGVESLVEHGFKEIILTGIHTGAYGYEWDYDVNLLTLLEKLGKVPGLVRLRLSSLEPNDISIELLDLMASGPPFCRHLHIPLQSGDDYVLKRMKRKYDTAFYRNLIELIRQRIPGVGITTDVMVGFPGEQEENFINSCNFIKEISFSGLHVFKYSPRHGTPAAKYPDQVKPQVKDRRSHELINIGHEMSRSFAAQYLNKTVEVLAEQPVDKNNNIETFEGLTDNYIRVFFPVISDCKGELIQVKIDKLCDTGLKGRII